MAINRRLQKNDKGEIFFPMNVDGFSYEENFMNTKKLAILGVMALLNFILLAEVISKTDGLLITLIAIGVVIFIDQLVVRYTIFEEKYFYRMYMKLKKYRVSNLSIFWFIRRIRKINDVCVMEYANNKISVLVELERDTIIGRNDDFEEKHYDAMSEMIKELNIRKLSWIRMNIMEPAGNDPRIQELDANRHKSGNNNMTKLVGALLAHVKKITKATLYEKDYIMIYTEKRGINAEERFIGDALSCVDCILDGAYIGYKILGYNELVDFYKESYGVKYFNYIDAVINIAKNTGIQRENAIELKSIRLDNGETREINISDINNILNSTSDKPDWGIENSNLSVDEALNRIQKEERSIKNKMENVSNTVDNDSSTDIHIDIEDELFGVEGEYREEERSINSKVKVKKVKEKKNKRKEKKNKTGKKKSVEQSEIFQLDDDLELDNVEKTVDDEDIIDF